MTLAILRAEIAAKIRRAIGDASELETAIPGFILVRRDEVTSSMWNLYEPHLGVLVQGRKRVVLGKETFEYDSSRYLVTSVDVPTVSRVVEASDRKPYLCCVLKLDLDAARNLMVERGLPAENDGTLGRGIATGALTPELLGAISRLLDLLDTPADIPVLAGLLHREILYRLLVGESGARLRQIVSVGSQSNRTARAVSWLKANYREPLRIEVLARHVRMGVSTLHHHFRAMTAMSPLQYQKQLRLHEARRLMLVEEMDAGTAAFQVGYESPTQFSREYSRLFGQPPRRDVRAMLLGERLNDD